MIPYPVFRSILMCAGHPTYKDYVEEVKDFDGCSDYIDEAEMSGVIYRTWLYARNNSFSTVRQFTGWSRAKFAREFGIYAKTLEAWEKGTSQPRQWVIDLLAYAVICGGVPGEEQAEKE